MDAEVLKETLMARAFQSAVYAACTLCSSIASAQLIVNGDFQTNTLSPWVVAPTPSGVSLATGVSGYDIDGPGPQPASLAARFMVGTSGPPPVVGWNGVELTQPVSLEAGRAYTFWVRWSVRPLVNVYSQSGGRFDLIVNGEILDTDIAPVTTPQLAPAYGWLRAVFTPVAGGPHQVGVRITRPVLAGEEVFQYLDNFGATGCWADCNADGQRTVSDFVCFQSRFVMQDPWADCDESSAFTVADFGCFQTKFVAGCP